jgi:hypothetical protein
MSRVEKPLAYCKCDIKFSKWNTTGNQQLKAMVSAGWGRKMLRCWRNSHKLKRL